ncbi:hypothetical protein JCM3775_006905 [Rhodotorula graminis]
MSAHSPSPPSSSAAVSLPPALVVPSTPRPAPARRAKASDGSNSDELARAEVLELTLFAEKKEWIEDKIKFLSALPPVDVVSPEPPHPATATRAELDAWWAEHDRIETEVDEYDMGDLARMRQFARDKSKQALSPRDTDLIEITLTTLFAVDRLLHLLRQRRKALTLLGYRLQWEDAVSTAWAAQRQIIADLSTFLANAAWALPASAAPRLRQPFGDAASLSTSPSLSSLSSLASSRSLSLLVAPVTSSPTTPSLRASTRTHLVTLQHSALSTLAHQLHTSLVPASATALDKLIDASPQSLPEPFLDEQDRLEAECSTAARGLREFLGGVSAQRTQADALAADAAAVSTRVVAAAGDRAVLADLRAVALPALHGALARLPVPTHALAPAQRAANAGARSALEGLVDAAEEAVVRAEGRARARARLDEVQGQAQRARERLEAIEARWRGLVHESPHGVVESASAPQEERDRDAALEALEPELRDAVADARAVQPDAARVIVAAREAGVPRELVKAVRGAAEELSALVGEVEERVEAEQRWREGREAAREVLRALARARERVEEGVRALTDEARRARWTRAAPADDEAASPRRPVLDNVRVAQDALLVSVLARVDALAAAGQPPPPLASPAAELVAALREDTTAALESLERLCGRVLAQKIAVRALDVELGVVEGDLAQLAVEVEALRPGAPLSPLEERLAQCAASLERVTSSAHARVPLLAGPAPAGGRPEPPFDLAEQDGAVRSYVNERCARASGSVDEVRRSLCEVEHGRAVAAWDEAVERLEREVAAIEKEADHPDDAAFAAHLSRLDTLAVTDLPSTTSSLSHLLSDPCATSRCFATSHADRQTRLDNLAVSFGAARESLVAAQAERRAQRAALVSALTDRADTFMAIVGDAKRARLDGEGVSEMLASSSAALLKSADLAEHSALDRPALERLERSLASLRERQTEMSAALDALREQVASSSADVEARAAVSAADAAADSGRVALQAVEAAVGRVQEMSSSWASKRDEVLRDRRREAVAAPAAAAVAAVARTADAQRSRSPPPGPRAVGGGAAGVQVLVTASSASVPEEPPSTPTSAEPTAPIVVPPSSPSPSSGRRRSLGSLSPVGLGPDEGAADDPFGSAPAAQDPFHLDSPGFDEPASVVHLRQCMQKATAHEWLDADAVLQLPSAADAHEVEQLVARCRADLDDLDRLPHERLLWTDLDALKAEQQSKETAAARVSALARFAERVAAADLALSDLLVAVDATTPAACAPSPEPGSTPALSLAEALVAASEAVTAVRVGAIPVVDDARVARAIERIEESWSELLGLVEDVRPRSGSTASTSSSSSRHLTRGTGPSAVPRTPSRTSQASNSSLSVSSRSSSRTSSLASTRSPRPSSGTSSARHETESGFGAPQTPRSTRSNHGNATRETSTLIRRRQSALPATTPRRAPSTAQRPTSTAAHPFSFDTPVRGRTAQSTSTPSTAPRRTLAASTRRESSTRSTSARRTSPSSTLSASSSGLFSPQKSHTPSSSSTRSSLRQSTASTASTRTASIASSRSSTILMRTPQPSIKATSPPSKRNAKAQHYSANLDNKLDREVGSIINALPQHVQIPIRIAEGKWTDESGVYNIGGRLYFCRILRSKQVMVRVGGGWLSLLQFLITHFGQVDGLTISPSSSLSKNLGSSKSQWVAADSVRNQLAASTSGTSLRDLLASSVSSTALSDLASSASATPLRQSLNRHVEVLPSPRRPRGSDIGLNSVPPSGPRSAAPPTPRAPRTPRPPVPIWRP